MIEFILGVAATLGSEFVLAHIYLWWENRQQAKIAANVANQNTVLNFIKTEAGKLAGVPSYIVQEGEAVIKTAEHDLSLLFSHTPKPVVTPTSNVAMSNTTQATPTPTLTVGSASGTAAVS